MSEIPDDVLKAAKAAAYETEKQGTTQQQSPASQELTSSPVPSLPSVIDVPMSPFNIFEAMNTTAINNLPAK
ncbi:hypothetical protein HED49_13470 [Ochrobactrum daejeonense]|nr:hypothetical protein [Brucella daejeonensis]